MGEIPGVCLHQLHACPVMTSSWAGLPTHFVIERGVRSLGESVGFAAMTSEEVLMEEKPSSSGASEENNSETNNKEESSEGLTKETVNYFDESKQKTLPLTKIDSETQTDVHQADNKKSPEIIPANDNGKKSEDKMDAISKEKDITCKQCVDDCIIDCLYCFTETCCRCSVM